MKIFIRSILDNFRFFLFFFFFVQNKVRGYALELPMRGCSNKCPQSMFWSKDKEIEIQVWRFSSSRTFVVDFRHKTVIHMNEINVFDQ